MSNTRFLRQAAWVYAAGLALHTADHLIRGAGSVTTLVTTTGAVTTTAGVVAIGLVLMRDRRGPAAASGVGIPIALGIVAVHLVPRWSALSDPFVGTAAPGVTAFSWLVVLIELAGAAAFGLAGIRLRRARVPH